MAVGAWTPLKTAIGYRKPPSSPDDSCSGQRRQLRHQFGPVL